MEQVTGSPTAKLVLLKLADNANELGYCYPSIPLIMRHTELSERAVREHLRTLVDLKILEVIRRVADGVKLPSHFQLLIRESADGMHSAHPEKARGAPPVMRQLQIEPLKKNPQEENPHNPAGAVATKGGEGKPRRLLGDYTPDAAAKDRAIKYWSARDRMDLVEAIDDQVERFLAHHRGGGSRMVDWDSVWQTWYCNAIQYNKAPQGFKPKEVAFEDCGKRGWIKRLEVFNGKTDSPKGTWSTKWGPPPGKPGCKVPPAAEAAFNRGERE